MNSKVDYVRSQGQTREHLCHWPGCKVQVPPAMWGCKSHWFMLPKALRGRIWRAYRPGQERDMDVSEEYIAAARAVEEWIVTHHAGVPQELQLELANDIGMCLELRADGRYYPTETGCRKLEEMLAARGVKVTVKIGADGRFAVT